jgi:hypothetical protein
MNDNILDKRFSFHSTGYIKELQPYDATTNPIYVNFSDSINSDPCYIIGLSMSTIQQNSGKKPNIIIMDSAIEDIIVNHPTTQDRFNFVKNVNPKLIPDGNKFLPDYFLGLKVIRISESDHIILPNTIIIGYTAFKENVLNVIFSQHILMICNILAK